MTEAQKTWETPQVESLDVADTSGSTFQNADLAGQNNTAFPTVS